MSLVETNPAPKPGMRAKVIEEYATLFRTHALAGPVLEIGGGAREGAVAGAPFLEGLERTSSSMATAGRRAASTSTRASPTTSRRSSTTAVSRR